MLLTPGARLGPYEIIAPLGAGGMGEVFRATDTRLGREVALKVLPAEVSADADRLARFEREARTVAGLNHPNIVTLHSIEDDGDVRFLTMELVDGRSLDHAVAPGGLPVPRLIDLGIALADALAAAHEKGVVHRDLKPANVMLTKNGRVKVLDFGLAKLAAPVSNDDLSQLATMATPISEIGVVVGTVPYMAPEQVRGEAVDARTDLFALGIVLYELATGQRPFSGATSADVGSAILRDLPKPLGSLRSELPRDFERVVGKCLEKDPRERVQTALDVSNDLRRLRKELERSESGAMASPSSDKVASIAVLPFVNRSASADDEYFSEGLADELLNVLSKIKGLRVSARTSSFHFKDKNPTIAEVGSALNVETVLEGSVRKAGQRVRIGVQLVKVSDGFHLWSETYDRTLDDIFAVQDDIAQSVVKELRTTLLGEAADSVASGAARAEVARAAKGRGTDPEAHRLYLLARHLIDRMHPEEMASAIEFLKQALERDPEFALAWSKLGFAYTRQAGQAWIPFVEGFRMAREAVERALVLEPDLADGHAILAWIQMYHDRDWHGARASYARALELAPGDAEVLNGAGTLAYDLGHLDEAIDLHQRALEKDPLSSVGFNRLGLTLQRADRLEESVDAFQKALEIAPQRAGTHAFMAFPLLGLGRKEEALEQAMLEPAEWARLWSLAIVHHAQGRSAESDEALRDLIAANGEDAGTQIAQAYAARGETDAAFEWLERAYAQLDPGLSEIKASTFCRPLHGDPRWAALLKKMGLGD